MTAEDWFDMTNCISALIDLGFPKCDIVILAHGIEKLLTASNEVISVETKKLIQDVLNEEKKQKSSIDPIDKKLHEIQAELLYVMIKQKLTEDMKRVEQKTIKESKTLAIKGD